MCGSHYQSQKHLMSIAHPNVHSVGLRKNFYLLKQTVTKFFCGHSIKTWKPLPNFSGIHWIPNIIVQFCCLRLYLGILMAGISFMHLSMLCWCGGVGARQGMGWGFDCLCWSWGRAFDWSCPPRGGDIWIFLRLTWRYLTDYLDEKDWDWTCVSHFHASRMRRMVWKDLEIMEAN